MRLAGAAMRHGSAFVLIVGLALWATCVQPQAQTIRAGAVSRPLVSTLDELRHDSALFTFQFEGLTITFDLGSNGAGSLLDLLSRLDSDPQWGALARWMLQWAATASAYVCRWVGWCATLNDARPDMETPPNGRRDDGLIPVKG